ncbi:MAG: CoB--CoM heterodisulfide reductase iron-sulfur subunit A family protein [Thaumarchaeota archaeon]|jgi:heterodisulfide reductase subunit A|nr:CoB--CoM heterodisulfide reductase iron-sulfur subunit A family protein [Candidatus Geocrenenecus arthurdayi]
MDRKIGVYICHCGLNIASTVNVQKLTEFAQGLEGVVIARDCPYMCSDPGQELIKKDIKEYGLTNVVVASCSPTMHGPTFQKVCEEAGLNPYMFQMVNIREHVSWVTDDVEKATEKAKLLVAAAVNRVKFHEPLEKIHVPLTQSVLIVGGGITGIEAALKLANSGKKVYLVEREPSIGGRMAQLEKTFPTLDCASCILTPKMVDVASNPNITILAYSEIKEVSGYIGNYKVKVVKKPRYVDENKCIGCGLCATKCPSKVLDEFNMGLSYRKAIYIPFPQAVPRKYTIDRGRCLYFTKNICRVCERFCPTKAINFEQKPEEITLEVGAVILATGYDVFDPSVIKRYGYGRYKNVYTGLEVERLTSASGPTNGRIILRDGRTPSTVVIIHCVGSRDENYHVYCSRVCCMYAMKLAHLIKERAPNSTVYELYIDIRAHGKGYEEFYRRVQEEGVIFIRGKAAEITESDNGKLIVTFEDTLLGKVQQIEADMVVLATALEPRKDARELARIFNIPVDKNGFFLERHPKLAPVSTVNRGVFVAGACQGPKDIPDSVAQGAAAAAEALALLSQGVVEAEPVIAEVNKDLCSGCRICISVCPYNATVFDRESKTASVREVLCQGCGTCVASCPSGARTLRQRGFTDKQIIAEIEAVLPKRFVTVEVLITET